MTKKTATAATRSRKARDHVVEAHAAALRAREECARKIRKHEAAEKLIARVRAEKVRLDAEIKDLAGIIKRREGKAGAGAHEPPEPGVSWSRAEPLPHPVASVTGDAIGAGVPSSDRAMASGGGGMATW